MSDPGQPPEGGWPAIHPDAGADAGPTPDPAGGAPDPAGGAPNPWDPPSGGSGAPAAPVPPVPPPGYVPSAGSISGVGSSGTKRIKPASVGRRPPSIAIVGGLGLLGLLITIAIMALMANRVLSGTDDAITGTVPPELTTATTVPADPGVPSTTAAGGVQGLTGGAAAAGCQVDRSTLELAAQAYEIDTGAPPADQQALVDTGFLSESIDTFQVAVGPSGVQITGVGDCAGL